MATSSTVQRGTRWERRRTGAIREVIGFTKQPDGIKRARLSNGTSETKVKVDQIYKTYRPV